MVLAHDPPRRRIPPLLATLLAGGFVAVAAGPEPAAAQRQDPATSGVTLADTSARADRSPPAWTRIVGATTGVVALASFDPAVRRRSLAGPSVPNLAEDESLAADVAEFGNSIGDWRRTLPLVAGVSMAVGGATEGFDGMGRAAALLAGVAAGSFANEGLNQAIGRSRPSWDEGAFAFDPLSGHASFPSGHTAFAFSIAGGVDAVTDGWVPAALAYGAATTSAFARVYADKHWFSDVVVGAAVGAIVSREAARRVLRALDLERSGRGSLEDGASADPGAAPERPDRAHLADRAPRVEFVATPSFLGLRVRF